MRSRRAWAYCIAGIIAAGILSRIIHTGFVIFDKYLGDALYAAMIYAIVRLRLKPEQSVICAMLLMTAIELFQLTHIPAALLASDHVAMRILARLSGTVFSIGDLIAYATGIAILHLATRGGHWASEGPDRPGHNHAS